MTAEAFTMRARSAHQTLKVNGLAAPEFLAKLVTLAVRAIVMPDFFVASAACLLHATSRNSSCGPPRATLGIISIPRYRNLRRCLQCSRCLATGSVLAKCRNSGPQCRTSGIGLDSVEPPGVGGRRRGLISFANSRCPRLSVNVDGFYPCASP